MRYAWSSFVDVAAAGFPATSQYALEVSGFSCFFIRLIRLYTLRIRLQFYMRQPWRLIYLVEYLLLGVNAYAYKSQALCCRERLRVIVFDETAILSSERALNCTNTLCFDEVSKYLCMVRSLACPSCIEFLTYFDRRPIRFTAVKNTDCLSLSRLLPPGINPLLIIE